MKDREKLPWSASGHDMWVFAYGSLMWKPDFPHVDVRDARLYGYHRGLCIYSHAYRGTPEKPGLVFGLHRGGSCRGKAFRVAARDIDGTVETLYAREMVTNVYHPVMGRTEIAGVGRIPALTFVADTTHDQYAGALDEAETVRLILQGKGPAGPCIEYVANTAQHLRDLGIPDHHLERIVARARRAPGGGS